MYSWSMVSLLIEQMSQLSHNRYISPNTERRLYIEQTLCSKCPLYSLFLDVISKCPGQRI